MEGENNKAKQLQLLEKYKKNEHTEEELLSIFEWINSEEGAAELDEQLGTGFDLEQEQDTVSCTSQEMQDELQAIKSRAGIISPTRSKRSFGLFHYAAAVVLALLVAGSALLVLKNPSSPTLLVFSMEKGNKGCMQLPDGTKVWLNGQSLVTYDNTHTRQITLEGEAYLEVAKNSEREFIVKTKDIDVMVFGTAFNVAAYPNAPVIDISLVEGSVGIRCATTTEVTKLTPGLMARFHKQTGKIELHEKDIADMSLWKNNELRMHNLSASALYRKMEGWYSTTIKLKNEGSKKNLYNIVITNETLEEILALINKITPITYAIKDNEVEISYQ